MCCDLSIIIHAYNAEKYIRRCVMSTVSLYGMMFEVILVDDGSSDGTGKLCDEFTDKYENVKVIHKVNGGVVSARNMGLHAAKGKYITFVDADDWIRAEFLVEAVGHLEDKLEIDIVVGSMVRSLCDGRTRPIFPKEQEGCILSGKDGKEALFKREYFGWELCGKVYRKMLFDGWKADETIRICEDLDASWEIFTRAATVLYIPAPFYYYFWNEESVTSGFHYLEAKSYLVFERILHSAGNVSCYIKEALTEHYIKSLVNIVRESYYHKKEKEEIEVYQNKLAAICSTVPKSWGQHVRAMYKSYLYTAEYLDEFKEYIAGRLREIYDSNKRVYYWGTGVVADYVSRLASQLGFDCEGYIVSDGELRKTSFRGKKVLYLSEIKPESADAIVLLVKRESQDLICKNLQNGEYRNVFRIDTRGIV